MTLLPTDSWEVKARLDLPAYELNDRCPITGSAWNLENHHLWRRSFGKDFREAWWVELKDGTVLPNRVNLAADQHEAVTNNRARIIYNDEAGLFFFVRDGRTVLLNPQPGPQGALVGRTAVGNPEVDGGAVQLTTDGREVPWQEAHTHTEEYAAEEECPRCHGVGKVVKRQTDVSTKPRVKAVYSIRAPKDEAEDGIEILTHVVDACIERDIKEGLLQSEKGAAYYVAVRAFHNYYTRPPDEA